MQGAISKGHCGLLLECLETRVLEYATGEG